MLHFPFCTYASPAFTNNIIDNYNSCSWAVSLNSMFFLNINNNSDDYQ